MVWIPEQMRQDVIARAQRRCEYCYAPLFALLRLEVDHIIPTSKGGLTKLDNLCLSCDHCNGSKRAYTHGIDPESGIETTLFNPRTQTWTHHFQWVEEGLRIEGLTDIGRATLERLNMNRADVIEARRYWMDAGWYPPHLEATP